MKKIFLLFIMSSLIQCAPKKIISGSKNSNIKSIIENEKLNVVYRGIRNPLTIYFPYADSIKVSGIGVYKTEESKYYIAPGLGTKVEITIIGYMKGEELIDKREFRIFDIQPPFASIDNDFGTIFLSKEKLANSIIECYVPQLFIEYPEVKSFQYQINKQQPLINNGNKFNELGKEQIYSLRKGDSVLINTVKLTTDEPNVDRARIIELVIYIE